MEMKGFLVPIAAAVSLGMPGPGSSPAVTNQDEIVQRFVCERSYINFAWGYQHSGIYVDRDGGVYQFNVQVGGYPTIPQGPTRTETEMETKYGSARKLLRTVSAGELRAMYALIPAAAKGPLSKKVSAGADRGSSASSCYLFDAVAKRYREVELDVVGDWTYRNLAPEAQKLAAWLASIDQPQPRKEEELVRLPEAHRAQRRKTAYWPGLRGVTGGRYDPVPAGGGGAADTL